ncbi:hypothetical protein ACWEVP_37765 [Amycolatopsis sp. NPDC003865]
MKTRWLSRGLASMLGRRTGTEVESGLGRLLEAGHRRRRDNVRNAHPRSDELYSDEVSVTVEVINTLAKEDQRAGRKLRGLMVELVSAAHRSARYWHALGMLRDHPQWRVHRLPGRPQTEHMRHEDETGEMYDRNRGLVSARGLLVFEIVLTLVEVFFWYLAFTSDLDRKAGWADPARLGAVAVALFLPAVTLLGARLAGALAHRWVMDYAGISRRRHRGAVVGPAVFGVLLLATFLLVLHRYDDAAVSVGSMSIPAWPMATIFAGALTADVVVRTYLVSEVRDQYRLRAEEFEKLRDKLVKANEKHLAVWLTLRLRIQYHRDQNARIVALGGGLLARSEAEHGDPHTTRTLPDAGEGLIAAPRPVHGVRLRSLLRLPDPRAPRLLGTTGVLVPSRSLEDAADALHTHRPWDAEILAAELQDLWDALHQDEPGGGQGGQWSGEPALKAS